MKKAFLFFVFLVCSSVIAQNEHKVYFDFDIDEANRTSGESLSNWIAQNKDVEVLNIYGYADSIGNAYYNIDLSERRAEYVLEQLKENNITVADDAPVKGFGEQEAFSVNRSLDRKVVIYYRQKEPATPAPEAKPKELTQLVSKAKKGDKIKLPSLNFYNYSDVILPTSKPILLELLDILKQNPDLKIDIQGHICCLEKEKDNIALKRAKAVYDFLIRNGINRERLSYKSFGSSIPVYPLPEKTEAEKVANRRVEIEIIEN